MSRQQILSQLYYENKFWDLNNLNNSKKNNYVLKIYIAKLFLSCMAKLCGESLYQSGWENATFSLKQLWFKEKNLSQYI